MSPTASNGRPGHGNRIRAAFRNAGVPEWQPGWRMERRPELSESPAAIHVGEAQRTTMADRAIAIAAIDARRPHSSGLLPFFPFFFRPESICPSIHPAARSVWPLVPHGSGRDRHDPQNVTYMFICIRSRTRQMRIIPSFIRHSVRRAPEGITNGTIYQIFVIAKHPHRIHAFAQK